MAALLVAATTSLSGDGFLVALLLGALNTAAGVAVRVVAARCAGWLGQRRRSTPA